MLAGWEWRSDERCVERPKLGVCFQVSVAAQKYVYDYCLLAVDLVDMVCNPFFTWLLDAPAGCSSLPGCMRMLTVLRVAAAYAFIDLQATAHTPSHSHACCLTCFGPSCRLPLH